MKQRLARATRWLSMAVLGLGLFRCNSGGDSSDGKSSWLQDCEGDGDCTGETSCHCGVCTKNCDRASECAGMPSSSTCVETAEGPGNDCRVGITTARGICLPACTKNAECAGSMRCEGGVCIPRTTVIDERDADGGPGGGGGGSSSGGAAGTGGTSSAPTPNAYGGPASSPENFASLCPSQAYLTRGQGSCETKHICNYVCQKDAQCPGVPGTTAEPKCRPRQYCELSCGGNKTCPTGMECIQTEGLWGCVWSVNQDCSFEDRCQTVPRPPDCDPGQCADLGVACDEALGFSCCPGLTCGADHYCVSGS